MGSIALIQASQSASAAESSRHSGSSMPFLCGATAVSLAEADDQPTIAYIDLQSKANQPTSYGVFIGTLVLKESKNVSASFELTCWFEPITRARYAIVLAP
jgi:putative Ca2+/H+ antiporter (TMEM165/GDT1 family)